MIRRVLAAILACAHPQIPCEPGKLDCMALLFGRKIAIKSVGGLVEYSQILIEETITIRAQPLNRQGFLLATFLSRLDRIIEEAKKMEKTLMVEEKPEFLRALKNLDRANYFATGIIIGDNEILERRKMAKKLLEELYDRWVPIHDEEV